MMLVNTFGVQKESDHSLPDRLTGRWPSGFNGSQCVAKFFDFSCIFSS